MLFAEEIWRYTWPIHSVSNLTFQKFIDPIASMGHALPSIKIKVWSTAPAKRRTLVSQTLSRNLKANATSKCLRGVGSHPT
ncbi:hypothetical protein TNCV_1642901 [Trichonephila clavipes]|nr:hypothetical protein TNCV_1642901 [Trichonephila clavipes]